MKPQLLCFDLDNTLWPVEPVIARAETAAWDWLLERSPTLANTQDLDSFRRRRFALVKENPGYLDNLTALRRDATALTLREAGHAHDDAETLAEGALAFFLLHRNRVEFFPGVVALLEKLKPDYRLAALSNGNASLERIGIAHFFDVVLSAESVGRAKPHPAMFEHALRATGVDAQHALHIGDHPEQDVAAARALGINAIWANPLQLPRPASVPDDVPSFETFDELAALIAAGETGR